VFGVTVLDEHVVVVAGAEVLVGVHHAGHKDGVADGRGIVAGDGEIGGSAFAAAVANVQPVLAHHAIRGLHHRSARWPARPRSRLSDKPRAHDLLGYVKGQMYRPFYD
jgi:hypothetical protein